ncbi:MAG TPA: hypothetical protein VKN64_06820 [Halanaerobiales bacterium]|nr:hypothetical protein [Halanaerobiales bacterium]
MKNYIWIPRILAIIFIIFISLFALDSFGTDAPLTQEIIGFLIHLIPTFFLVIILYIFWKKPLYCGLSYIVLAVFFTIYFNTYRNIYSLILVSLLPAFIGFLFIIFRKPLKRA